MEGIEYYSGNPSHRARVTLDLDAGRKCFDQRGETPVIGDDAAAGVVNRIAGNSIDAFDGGVE
jgi:hypothetical protein